MKPRKYTVTKKTYSAIQGIINKALRGNSCTLIFTNENLKGDTKINIKFCTKTSILIYPYQIFENDKKYVIETFNNNRTIFLKTSPTENVMINIVGKADENCEENILELRW